MHMNAILRHVNSFLHNKFYKYKEKFVILQSIGIIVIKSKETRRVICTCRYTY